MEKIDLNGFGDFVKDIDWAFDLPKDVRKYPLTDISHTENTLFIDLNIAGFDKNDIDLEVEGNTLIISGVIDRDDIDKTYTLKNITIGDFERKIKLHPDFVNGDIRAKYNNGLLNIEISRKEKPKQLIEIQ